MTCQWGVVLRKPTVLFNHLYPLASQPSGSKDVGATQQKTDTTSLPLPLSGSTSRWHCTWRSVLVMGSSEPLFASLVRTPQRRKLTSFCRPEGVHLVAGRLEKLCEPVSFTAITLTAPTAPRMYDMPRPGANPQAWKVARYPRPSLAQAASPDFSTLCRCCADRLFNTFVI